MSVEKLQKKLESAKKDLEILKKMNAPADEIEFAKGEVKELEDKIKNAPKEDSKKIETPKKVVASKIDKDKKQERKPSRSSAIMKGGRRKMVAKSKSENTKHKPVVKTGKVADEKSLNKSGKKKGRPFGTYKNGVSRVVQKNILSVTYKGKVYTNEDPNFCDILIKQIEERRAKRLEQKGKTKVTSLSAKVGDNISSSVVTAIRGAFKENKGEILENKTSANKFLKSIIRIEAAAERFIKEMKLILTNNFKQKDFDKEFKDVDELVKKIKETIKKSIE